MRVLLPYIFFVLFSSTLKAEQTLAIIKPDAVASRHIGAILSKYEQSGLLIVELKMVHLTPKQARQFYAIHEGKPFYEDLVEFMASGPAVAIVLEGECAIQKNRELIGAIDKPGTLRGTFGKDLTHNAVHGSDSPANALQEISFFF